jgi:transposase-like protein
MEAQTEFGKRQAAVHLLRSGLTPVEVSQELGRSRAWVYKWWRRFKSRQQWADLHDQSRAPKSCSKRLSAEVQQAIRRVRSELEAEAELAGHLGYIGAPAIRSRLKQAGWVCLPSIASIERVVARAGLTHPHPSRLPEVRYPHLQLSLPHQLTQVDIVPHYLPGGGCVSCFNAIDPVSHYPTGAQFLSKNASVAMQFLQQVWCEQGLSTYTQVDNESCFSGGTAHPGVLSKVVRLCLYVGTQLIFSPFYYPESNGWVERFHQDFNQHTWQKFELTDLDEVRTTSLEFFELFRHSGHLTSLAGRCPEEVHWAIPALRLPGPMDLPSPKLPLTAGQVHFIRRVSTDQTVSILYKNWAVPKAKPDQGVWATLEFFVPQRAQLRIYDAAPDAPQRTCLVEYPFPLQEPVLLLQPEFQPPIRVEPSWLSLAVTFFRSVLRTRVSPWVSTMF